MTLCRYVSQRKPNNFYC